MTSEKGPSSNELAHYGVKGMKWGVRKAERLTNRVAKGKEIVSTARASGKNTNRLALKTSGRGVLEVGGILIGGGVVANRIPNEYVRNGSHVVKLFMAGRQGAIRFGEVRAINAYNKSQREGQ